MSPSGTDFDGFGSAPTLAAAPAPILPLLLDPPQPAILQRRGGVAQPVNITKKNAQTSQLRRLSEMHLIQEYSRHISPV